MTEIIDAHHHLWRYSPQDYPWITQRMRVLHQDFLPPDVEIELRANHVDGCIAVQARQTLEETETLLGYSEEYAFLRGVVGWAPISSPIFPALLDELCCHRKLRGLRHAVQYEPDQNFILGEDFQRGVELLGEKGLVYDILIFEKHLPQVIAFVDRHPRQTFVLDHIGKPRIAEKLLSPCKKNLCALALRENVYCKLSGLVTEANWSKWTETDLQPYFDIVMQAFGPRRLMMGSDWPVCLLASSYSRWMQLVRKWVSTFSIEEQARILGGTAIEAYRLSNIAPNPAHGENA